MAAEETDVAIVDVAIVDVAIVGAGACGALASKLSRRGLSVVSLEAGKRFDPAADLANSEANAARIIRTEPRAQAGKHGMGGYPDFDQPQTQKIIRLKESP